MMREPREEWTAAIQQTPSLALERTCQAHNAYLKCHHSSSGRCLSLSMIEPDATAMGGLSNNQINK